MNGHVQCMYAFVFGTDEWSVPHGWEVVENPLLDMAYTHLS